MLCLYTKLCHIFLIVIPSFSIPWSVMMFAPPGMLDKICSCILFLYAQSCYKNNSLYISYSFCNNQWLCDQTYCKKIISLKVAGSWWSFCATIISLKHSTFAPGCNMPKIMEDMTFNIIHQRKELIITSIVRSEWFSLNTCFRWLLMGFTSYLLVEHFRFCIRIPCLSLWARFTFNSFMKTKTSFDGRRTLTTKNTIQNISTILKF